MLGFAAHCLRNIGRPPALQESLKHEGFTPMPAAEAPATPFRSDMWRAPGRPYLVAVIEGGLGCGVIGAIADGERARELLAATMRGLAAGGGTVVPLAAAEAQPEPRDERFQVRPGSGWGSGSGSVVMEVQLRINRSDPNRPGLIVVALLARDSALRT